MLPIEITSTLRSEILEIRWMPHNICNFRCRYCFPGAFEGTDKPPTDLDLVVKNFVHLMNWYKDNLGKTKFHFKLLGGEPTLFKGIEFVLNELRSKFDLYTTIVSNGSRKLEWWQQNGHLFDNVVLSYHAAQADIDHHIAVADTLFALGKKVTVLVLMDPEIWYQCVRDVDYMKRNSKHCWFIQAKEIVDWDGKHPIDYTDKQKKYLSNELKRYPSFMWFIKNRHLIFDGSIRLFESTATLEDGRTIRATSQTYINKGWNRFKGWSCDIGYSSIFVGSSGLITAGCGETPWGLDYQFNILDKDFAKKYSPRPKSSICSLDACTCQPDTHISKFKLSEGNIGRTRTVIPITDYRLLGHNKGTFIDIT